jgi:hypothetical protein
LSLDLSRNAVCIARKNLDPRVLEPLKSRRRPRGLIRPKLRWRRIASLAPFELINPLAAGFLVKPITYEPNEFMLRLLTVFEKPWEDRVSGRCVLGFGTVAHQEFRRPDRRRSSLSFLPAASSAFRCTRLSRRRTVVPGSLSSQKALSAVGGNGQPTS